VIDVGSQECELEMRGLRPSIDARPSLAQHFDGGGRDSAKEIIGAGEIDVILGLVAAAAEIEVHAAQA